VAPLLEVTDEYERYAVALVEKDRARLFSVFMGALEESDALRDEQVPARHDQGGVSQSHFQRHHDLHVLWHLKRVAGRLAALFRRRPFDRLILAGPEEVTSELRALLPDALARRVAAVVPLETSANEREVLEKTLEIEARVEREAEERLIQELLETAGAGGRATRGLAPTLEALWLGEVRTLVVADGAEAEGSECPRCGRLEAGDIATCPACGNAMRSVHDVFHRAMARTIEQAGRVEVVHGDAARRLLEAGGGLGALLRFRAVAAPVVA
jgi:peptide subunit release factor 1 (eRF1)